MIKPALAATAILLLAAAPAFAACNPIQSKTVPLTGCIDTEWQPIEGQGAQEFS